MGKTEQLNDKEINVRAYRAVYNELGVLGLIRFLRLKRLGKGDSTELRDALEKDLNWEDIEHEIAKLEKK